MLKFVIKVSPFEDNHVEIFTNKAKEPVHFGIPALPCLRFERQTGKPMPISS
jgi:hypothetical protein